MTESNDEKISVWNQFNKVNTLNRGRVLLWLTLLFSIALALWVQWPRITDPNTVQDDFRSFYSFNIFQDPELYPDDTRTATYRNTELQLFGLDLGLIFDITNNLRAGYNLLFYLASPLFAPILFNKLLIFPLILALSYYAFRIGQELKGDWTGFALAMTFAVFNLAAADSVSVAAGLPRSFAMPFLLALIYYLMMRRLVTAGIITAASGIIYPPVFVLSLATYLLTLLESIRAGKIRVRFNWKIFVTLLVLGIISLIMIPRIVQIATSYWQGLLSDSAAWGLLSDPIHQQGGRYPLFGQYPFVGLGGLFTKISTFWRTMVLFFLTFSIWLLVPRQERILPKALKQLLIASVACFVAAWAAIILASALTLYYPSRYLRATLPIVLLIFTVTNMEQALTSARLRFHSLSTALRATVLVILAAWTTIIVFLIRQDFSSFLNTIPRQSVEWLLVIASAFAIVALLLYILGSVQTFQEPRRLSGLQRLFAIFIACLIVITGAVYTIGPNQEHAFLRLSTPYSEYLDYIQTLPKDVKLASGSCVLENIPLLAKRQVLWNCETTSASKTTMIADTLKAYYASSLSDVFNFCHQYDVDYFVVSEKAFERSQIQAGDYFYEPFNSITSGEVTSQVGYVLGELPSSMRLYDNDDLVVMQCKPGNVDEQGAQVAQTGRIGVLAFDEISDSVSQAGEVMTTIKWMADRQVFADHDVCFSIKDSSGESRQKICEPLSAELPTSQWSIPEIRYETYKFRISPYLEGGDYSIVASVEAGEETDSRNAITIGEFTYNTLPRMFNLAQGDPELEYEAIWGEAIALADYTVTESNLNAIDVNMNWHALQRMAESYKVFAHLRIASTNDIVSQIDAIPRNWTYPTDWWEANEIIADTLSIPLGDLDPGQYELWIGFYNEESGERLPMVAFDNPTLAAKEGAIMIHKIVKTGS